MNTGELSWLEIQTALPVALGLGALGAVLFVLAIALNNRHGELRRSARKAQRMRERIEQTLLSR